MSASAAVLARAAAVPPHLPSRSSSRLAALLIAADATHELTELDDASGPANHVRRTIDPLHFDFYMSLVCFFTRQAVLAQPFPAVMDFANPEYLNSLLNGVVGARSRGFSKRKALRKIKRHFKKAARAEKWLEWAVAYEARRCNRLEAKYGTETRDGVAVDERVEYVRTRLGFQECNHRHTQMQVDKIIDFFHPILPDSDEVMRRTGRAPPAKRGFFAKIKDAFTFSKRTVAPAAAGPADIAHTAATTNGTAPAAANEAPAAGPQQQQPRRKSIFESIMSGFRRDSGYSSMRGSQAADGAAASGDGSLVPPTNDCNGNTTSKPGCPLPATPCGCSGKHADNELHDASAMLQGHESAMRACIRVTGDMIEVTSNDNDACSAGLSNSGVGAHVIDTIPFKNIAAVSLFGSNDTFIAAIRWRRFTATPQYAAFSGDMVDSIQLLFTQDQARQFAQLLGQHKLSGDPVRNGWQLA
ncbi:hypothetical protein HK105_202427 [Polyrhizophydium stewartii]|uniref:Uncharacterized protein n=1 Tax=Polyrhizophydium stewartii TaxID=2732419 RepID=A0ABR4NER2_9FUNG